MGAVLPQDPSFTLRACSSGDWEEKMWTSPRHVVQWVISQQWKPCSQLHLHAGISVSNILWERIASELSQQMRLIFHSGKEAKTSPFTRLNGSPDPKEHLQHEIIQWPCNSSYRGVEKLCRHFSLGRRCRPFVHKYPPQCPLCTAQNQTWKLKIKSSKISKECTYD